ncbi:MAG: 2Fe-2S iron-sulfur cluster binding domain-containing protein [SAR324 cluster bacterium]|nr:2Fe-2S iron-sulfur cluster binding domain-containing protein [SAR324 cluster bacterium]MCH8885181.1 2Fe-2S iron-sulfur cluster binding domain-containing protein [SAR324 cluster bacterium]
MQESGKEGVKEDTTESGKRSLSRLETEIEGPKQAFKITFLPMDKVVEAGPVDGGGHHEGLPGSVLDFAAQAGIEIDHACGGFAACSTCHVIVRQGLESCNEISDDEDEMLDEAPGLTMKSRLACQCVADGSVDLVVEIPAWNRNLAREEHS